MTHNTMAHFLGMDADGNPLYSQPHWVARAYKDKDHHLHDIAIGIMEKQKDNIRNRRTIIDRIKDGVENRLQDILIANI